MGENGYEFSEKNSVYRKYNVLLANKETRPMRPIEILDESIDTIKIARRKCISGKDTLKTYYSSDKSDYSLYREGFIDAQMGIEMFLKGLIEYYGESYLEAHHTKMNGSILENLSREYPNLLELREAFEILQDNEFAYMMYKCSKFPKYQKFSSDKKFRYNIYQLIDLFIKYADQHILTE